MKIRSGFVSNSSSSSFILVGVKMDSKSLLNNPEYKEQFEKEVERAQLDSKWEKILNNPDFDKYKTLYDTCKVNNVSVPQEVSRFFGGGFKGVYESSKVNELSLLNEMIYEEKFKFPKGISVLTDEGPTYIGKIMATNSDDYFDNGSISIQQLKQYTQILTDIGFNEEDVKIYYGTRAC
jgi:hypothetical protein